MTIKRTNARRERLSELFLRVVVAFLNLNAGEALVELAWWLSEQSGKVFIFETTQSTQ